MKSVPQSNLFDFSLRYGFHQLLVCFSQFLSYFQSQVFTKLLLDLYRLSVQLKLREPSSNQLQKNHFIQLSTRSFDFEQPPSSLDDFVPLQMTLYLQCSSCPFRKPCSIKPLQPHNATLVVCHLLYSQDS